MLRRAGTRFAAISAGWVSAGFQCITAASTATGARCLSRGAIIESSQATRFHRGPHRSGFRALRSVRPRSLRSRYPAGTDGPPLEFPWQPLAETPPAPRALIRRPLPAPTRLDDLRAAPPDPRGDVWFLPRMAGMGRVGVWRSGGRPNISVAAPFVWRCLTGSTVAPFPHPPGHRRRSPAPGSHRTWRADLPHQRSSEVGSQHCERLQLRVWEAQFRWQ